MSQVRTRIALLDALRGVALFGMLLVHATYYVNARGTLDAAILSTIHVAAESKFYTLFSLLFGMSFAVQMRTLDARSGRVPFSYFRRVLALAIIGVATHLLLGYWVLILYSVWALVLVLFRRATVRVLLFAAVLLWLAPSARHLTVGTFELMTRGRVSAEAGWTQYVAQRQAAYAPIQSEMNQGNYRRVVQARWRQLVFRVSSPGLWTALDPFLFFLFGALAIRSGLIESAEQRRRTLWWIAAAGLTMFIIARIVTARGEEPSIDLGFLRYNFAVESLLSPFYMENWLGLAYAAGITLLMTRSATWHARLGVFSWAGRMALTNYVLQIVLLEALFSRHALHLPLPVVLAPVFAGVLFALQVVWSRWWFDQFAFGPLEWLWRSFTYLRWQPLTRAHAQRRDAVPAASV